MPYDRLSDNREYPWVAYYCVNYKIRKTEWEDIYIFTRRQIGLVRGGTSCQEVWRQIRVIGEFPYGISKWVEHQTVSCKIHVLPTVCGVCIISGTINLPTLWGLHQSRSAHSSCKNEKLTLSLNKLQCPWQSLFISWIVRKGLPLTSTKVKNIMQAFFVVFCVNFAKPFLDRDYHAMTMLVLRVPLLSHVKKVRTFFPIWRGGRDVRSFTSFSKIWCYWKHMELDY